VACSPSTWRAQRILAAQLRPDSETDYWGEREVDLTGAVLLDFDLRGCRLGPATFDGASFAEVSFTEAAFSGSPDFGQVQEHQDE
jgi:uncharacterized protein YjbI with pentapeptide repeats